MGHRRRGGIQPLRRALEPQGPDQHLRHLPPGDGVPGPEAAAGVGHVVGRGGLDGAVPAQRRGHVAVGGRLGRHRVPAHHPHQHRRKLGPGHGVAVAEGGGVVAAHQAVIHGLGHLVRQRAVRGHVGKARLRRPGRRRQQSRRQRRCQQAGQESLHGNHPLLYKLVP